MLSILYCQYHACWCPGIRRHGIDTQSWNITCPASEELINTNLRLWTQNVPQNVNDNMLLKGHDDVIKWKHFPRKWPFVRGIHRSPVNSPHRGQWRGALLFPLICAWINDWVNNGEAGDLRRHRVHHDVTVMVLKEMWISSLFYSKGIDQQGLYRMYRLFHIQTEGSGGS